MVPRLNKQSMDQNMKTKIFKAILLTVGMLAVGAQAQVTTSTAFSGGLNEPYGVVEDSGNNIYLTDSGNNRIVRIDNASQAATTLAGGSPGYVDGPFNVAQFNNPQGLLQVSIGGTPGLLVADFGNNAIRFVRLSDGYVSTIAGNGAAGPATDAAGTNATFRYPLGMDQDGNGNVYIADSGNNAVRVINLNDPAFGVTNLLVSGGAFLRPAAVAFAGTNQIWVADAGTVQNGSDNTIKLFALTTPTVGSLTTFIGGNNKHLDGSYKDSPIGGTNVLFNEPCGLLWVSGVGLLISDSDNNLIRLATTNPVYGATNYSVSTFAGTVVGTGSPGTAGLVNGNALSSEFNSPYGLTLDPNNNAILVADGVNKVIRRIQTGVSLPAVPAPSIGWVDFQIDAHGNYTSILRTDSPFVFNNDVIIAIAGTAGTLTHFTYGATPANPLVDTIPNPTSSTGNVPPAYQDGLSPSQVQPSIVSAQPDLTVKALGYASGRPNSPIASARFQFQTATPSISGNNAAQFTVNDVTASAQLWYTIDGSTPTNAPPSIGPVSSGTTLSIPLISISNLTFNVQAFRANYAPSSVASQTFSASNFVANTISFGFASGEASSVFLGSSGQTFYAPVTLTTLPGTVMYSLQFNFTVTNTGAAPSLTPGAFDFQSMLMEPIPNITPVLYTPILPEMFTGTGFSNLLFKNFSENLLGVGWLERVGEKNLYDTTKQTLITYSLAHDDLFPNPPQPNGVIVGGYSFQIPATATNGQQYQIQIGRPSATSDGVGAPGSDVYIVAPTNGATAGGAPVNAIKYVTVTNQLKYIAGSVYPFRWFNAGDFGSSSIVNADVEQVFQSAVYSLNYPPAGSDFFDAMDSCGYTYIDNGKGYLEKNTLADTSGLFDGNDTTINQIAFGDGVLDVCDVYVTYRRSLDPSLTWFERYWNNGELVADTNAPNLANHLVMKSAASPAAQPKIVSGGSTVSPQVHFSAGDITNGSSGQVVPVPINATIYGSYPLRVLMLNLTVEPLDGSPALATPVQFTQNAAVLGAPYTTDSQGNGNYAAVWLNSTNAGLTGTVILGTLSVTIPAGASTNAAYAVHFDHASASPNGLASFPKQTLTGLITLSSRITSNYGDGIPDSWRLRWFGTVNNLLSVSNACPTGDGISNWMKYVAGVDPNTANDFPSTNPVKPAPPGSAMAIHWPSVSGKQYVIERSSSLFSGSWTAISTNTGTGTDMEFDDNNAGGANFYRVLIVP
jgi:hypothetical protein